MVSVDVFKNDDADANVTLQLEDAWTAQADAVRGRRAQRTQRKGAG